MPTGEIIALISVIVAAVALILNTRGSTRSDARDRAVTDTKLDNIINGVTDIRVEQRAMRQDITTQGQAIAEVKASVASAHKRIDDLSGTVNRGKDGENHE